MATYKGSCASVLALVLAGVVHTGMAVEHQARPYAGRYEVTVTNLTHGQWFSPALLTTHSQKLHLFQLGEPASPELSRLAQEGDNAPLAAVLRTTRGVTAVVRADGPLMPGKTLTLHIDGKPGLDVLSLVAMMVPTNDGFVAVDGVRLPWQSAVYTAIAHDAGGERNDELCSSVPMGPAWDECGGPGGGAMVGAGEGMVLVHSGIHGVGNIKPAWRDWRNPVARIRISRLP